MVTPAVHNNATIRRDGFLYYYRPSTGWELVDTFSNRWRYVYQERPRSVSNPRRADLTRPPSRWQNDWCKATAPLCDWYGVGWEAGWKATNVCLDVPSHEALRPSHFHKDLEDAAWIDALTKLKDSKVNLGSMLAEARQTAELLSGTINRVAHAVDAWRRKRPGDLKKWAASGGRGIPSSYLEMCYGWTPLMGEVYDSAEALADAWVNSGRKPSFTVAGTATRTFDHTLPWSDFTVDCPYEGSYRESARVVLCNELPMYLLQPLVQTGITNPFEVAWNVTRASFVVDWFLPVGNWLHTLDAAAYSHFKEGSLSRMQQYDLRAVCKTGTPSRWIVTPTHPGFARGGRFRRDVIYTLPLVPPLPSLKNPLSLDKVAKASALLTQAFKSLDLPEAVMRRVPRYVFK